MKELIIKNAIEINASIERVWDALTNPEKTKVYMFGCKTVTDWNVGSELLWKGCYEGKEMVFVKGYIIQILPPKILVYSTIDPNSEIEDKPEKYLNVTYELSEDNGVTTLIVSQGDYSKVENGEKRYNDSWNNGEGWNPVLIQIKKLVENKL